MKFPVEKLVKAIEIIERCPKVNAIDSSLIVRLSKKASAKRLTLRTAADTQAVAQIGVDNAEEFRVYLDRPLLAQWVKGLRKTTGDATLTIKEDFVLIRAGGRSGKFPTLVSVGGYEEWDKGEKTERIDFDSATYNLFRLALHYAGGEGIEPSLNCLWLGRDSLLATNQLTMMKADVSPSVSGPVPLDLVKVLTPDASLIRSPVAALVKYEDGVIYRSYDLVTLSKFPEQRMLDLFHLAGKFSKGVTLYPCGAVLEQLRELSALVNKADAQDTLITIDTRKEEGKALFVLSTVSGSFRTELPVNSPADRVTVLIPPLMPYLAQCSATAAVEILYGDDQSPYLVRCSESNVELLISRKVKA